jgi:photosystem II stability/assembly factor-like uncharacterized protein
MLRSFSIAAAVAGVAAGMSAACSGSFAPSRAESRSPTQGSGRDAEPRLTAQESFTENRLQAVSPVNSRVVWASGVGGTFVVTTDGGKNWTPGVVEDDKGVPQTQLQFRDVQGVSAKVAYLLAAGSGEASRIYKTKDGGTTWTLQFTNRDPNAFYDCFDFWSPNRGLTFSDPVEGRFPTIRTSNGGRTWQDIGDQMPPALDGEFGFAASGTCVDTQGDRRAWIATGGAAKARILATTDRGNSWEAYNTPIVSGPSAGGFTVAFRDRFHGILAGGDLDPLNPRPNNRIAVSSDGGQTWKLVKPPPFDGAVFGLSYVPESGRRTVVITGPGGAAWSRNEGEDKWKSLPGVRDFWAVAFASRKAGWLVGTEGRILKVSFDDADHSDDDHDDDHDDDDDDD